MMMCFYSAWLLLWLTEWLSVCLLYPLSTPPLSHILNYFECYLPQNVCLNKPKILRLQIGIIINSSHCARQPCPLYDSTPASHPYRRRCSSDHCQSHHHPHWPQHELNTTGSLFDDKAGIISIKAIQYLWESRTYINTYLQSYIYHINTGSISHLSWEGAHTIQLSNTFGTAAVVVVGGWGWLAGDNEEDEGWNGEIV